MRTWACVTAIVLVTSAGCDERAVGIPDSCGDRVLDLWEECDETELGGTTCFDLGFEGGTLRCDSACQFDTRGCADPRDDLCGDGVCQPAEDPVICPDDCTDNLCGDGVCQPAENPVICPEDCNDDDAPPLPQPGPWGTPGHWWVLMHPNGASAPGPGIHLVDTVSVTLLRTLPLPEDAESPHGLAAEADRVWLADMTSGKIYHLRPDDGSVIATLPGGRTEGLAITSTGYWSADEDWPEMWIQHHRLTGGVDFSLRVNSSTVNDLAYDGNFIYYVINGATDPIMRIDVHTNEEITLVPTTTSALYTLAYDGQNLVIDIGDGLMYMYDAATGDDLVPIEHGIGGWVTAIAPAWGQ